MTEQELLALVPAENQNAVKAYLEKPAESVPVIIQILLFVGAIVSFAALAGTLWLTLNSLGRYAWIIGGILFTAGGYGLYRAAGEEVSAGAVFLKQFAFIFSVSGRILFICGVMEWLSAWLAYGPAALLVLTALSAVVAGASWRFFKLSLDRFVFCSLTLGAFAAYLHSGYSFAAVFAPMGVCYLAAGLFLFAWRAVLLRPLAYALVLAGIVLVVMADGRNVPEALVLASGLAALAVVSVKKLSFKRRALGCLIVVLAACFLGLNGLLSLCLLAAGRYWRERMIEWLGSAGFVCSLYMLYYGWETTLWQKSLSLAVCGLVLLLVYWGLKRSNYAR